MTPQLIFITTILSLLFFYGCKKEKPLLKGKNRTATTTPTNTTPTPAKIYTYKKAYVSQVKITAFNSSYSGSSLLFRVMKGNSSLYQNPWENWTGNLPFTMYDSYNSGGWFIVNLDDIHSLDIDKVTGNGSGGNSYTNIVYWNFKPRTILPSPSLSATKDTTIEFRNAPTNTYIVTATFNFVGE